MKKISLLLHFILITVVLDVHAQNLVFDAKYVKVGVMSNEWPPSMANNPNIRRLGTLQNSSFDENTIGKKVLDVLFHRDGAGLHIDQLYEEALQNTTVEEIEVALKDASAETDDVLKKEIAPQLLKNNYIVTFSPKQKKNGEVCQYKNGEIKKVWSVYHVEINDRIIEQAYQNWRNPALYDQIKVPVKLVAKGKVHKNYITNNELVYDIAKKVPAFAVRGPVISRYPLTARFGSDLGSKNSGRIYLYRMKEKSGTIYSKKVCTTRATTITKETTRMHMISGNFPSSKKGDVAVLKDRHRSSVSLLGQFSFGKDFRMGGRMEYEGLLHFNKGGLAHYYLLSFGYNCYKKEPKGVWLASDMTYVQPVLHNIEAATGYGVGFNLFGRLELMPYALCGYQHSSVSGGVTPNYWDEKDEKWYTMYKDDYTPSNGIIGYVGTKANINIWYPLQLTIGADYNVRLGKKNPILSNHKLNRVNLYAGFRIHF